jgi:hypothetical protein
LIAAVSAIRSSVRSIPSSRIVCGPIWMPLNVPAGAAAVLPDASARRARPANAAAVSPSMNERRSMSRALRYHAAAANPI